MPTFRDVITGLTIGTTLAGGIVALGAIASTTAANATVVQGQFDDGDGLLASPGGTATAAISAPSRTSSSCGTST